MWVVTTKRVVSVANFCAMQLLFLGGVLSRPESLSYEQQQQQQQHLSNARQRLPDTLVADVDYFDKLNVDSQLSNRRFVELQIKCLIYDGPCDIFGRKAKGKQIMSHFHGEISVIFGALYNFMTLGQWVSPVFMTLWGFK